MSRLRIFAGFWWDFVVGDDWRMTLGLLLAIGATLFLSHAGLPGWWIVPAAAALLLRTSLRRATGQRRI